MKRKPVDELVFELLFPRLKPSDPQNFQAFLTRHLIYEVRQEVHAFYGHIDDLESKYPGLDYCHPIHRIRLSRWQWHRRLFRAFDNLRLTQAEIYGLTKWEGTKWAKERYEREQNITIRDTTADTFGDWVEPEDRHVCPGRSLRDATMSLLEDSAERDHALAASMSMDASESEDEVQTSIGVELNERLRLRVAAYNAGDMSQPLDEEWEQWLKNALETGELSLVADEISRMSSRPAPSTPDDIFPERMLNAARAGRWEEVPELLQDMIRRSLARERQSVRSLATATPDAVSSSGTGTSATVVTPLSPPPDSFSSDAWRRSHSILRPPSSRSTPSSLRRQP